MLIQQSPALQHSDYSPLVAKTDEMVNFIIDPLPATVVWDLESGEWGQPRIVLRLRGDSDRRASTTFDPNELRLPAHFNLRLAVLRDAFVRINRWREELRELYEKIRTWSASLPEGASVREEPIVLIEERSGEYQVTRLVITSGGASMKAEPVAAWVVGADGRVDLKGVGGPFTLLYSVGEGWTWVMDTFPPRTEALSEDLFLDLAEACLHG